MSAYLSSEDSEFLADLRVAMLAASDELTIVLVARACRHAKQRRRALATSTDHVRPGSVP